MAGSPIPRETAQAFLDRGVLPQNVYGMTENGSHQYTLPGDDPQTIVETCGRACAAYEIRIWDQDNPDIEAAPGAVGEIGGRGACLTLGYFDNQQATEESFNRARLVHERRSRPARRQGLSRDRRAQKGPDHPRRAQHPSRADRGSGDAPSRSRPLRRICGRRSAARREGLPRGDPARRRERRSGRSCWPISIAPACRATTCRSISSR